MKKDLLLVFFIINFNINVFALKRGVRYCLHFTEEQVTALQAISDNCKNKTFDFSIEQENCDKILEQFQFYYCDYTERFCWSYERFVVFSLEVFGQKIELPPYSENSKFVYAAICHCLYDVINRTMPCGGSGFGFLLKKSISEVRFNQIFQETHSEKCFIQ